MKFSIVLFMILLAIPMSAQNFHSFTLTDIDGNQVPLLQYEGKVVVVVNVASFCGYTPQYTGLEELYQAHKNNDVVVIGIPANDFGAQEPGTNEEIKEFCSTTFNVTFPMFSKVTVKGADKIDLYQWLTSGGGDKQKAGEVRWNFEKFVITPSGELQARFGSGVEPMDDELIAAITEAKN